MKTPAEANQNYRIPTENAIQDLIFSGVDVPEEHRCSLQKYIRRTYDDGLYDDILRRKDCAALVRFLACWKRVPLKILDALLQQAEEEKVPELTSLLLEYRISRFTPATLRRHEQQQHHLSNGPMTVADWRKIFKITLYRGKARIRGYLGDSESVTIPAFVGPYPVESVSLNECIRHDMSPITEVILPEGITRIEEKAFQGCAFSQISLPQSLREIGAGAFSRCLSLKEIRIPEGVTRLPNQVFQGCILLKTVILPQCLTEIGTAAFDYCLSLQNITLGDQLRIIHFQAFASCHQLTHISLPGSLLEIHESAFQDAGLNEIRIPEGVQLVGIRAFYNCAFLRSLSLPDGLIPSDTAFFRCESLADEKGFITIGNTLQHAMTDDADVTIPTGVEVVGCSAINLSFTEILRIPEGIREIRSPIFACRHLKELHLPASLQKMNTVRPATDAGFVIHAPKGSYAARIARRLRIPLVGT